ncbi:hypothetical protein DMH27_04410 [Raoultella planticola]|nr:hypothetical protein [Raoultella planticola]
MGNACALAGEQRRQPVAEAKTDRRKKFITISMMVRLRYSGAQISLKLPLLRCASRCPGHAAAKA